MTYEELVRQRIDKRKEDSQPGPTTNTNTGASYEQLVKDRIQARKSAQNPTNDVTNNPVINTSTNINKVTPGVQTQQDTDINPILEREAFARNQTTMGKLISAANEMEQQDALRRYELELKNGNYNPAAYGGNTYGGALDAQRLATGLKGVGKGIVAAPQLYIESLKQMIEDSNNSKDFEKAYGEWYEARHGIRPSENAEDYNIANITPSSADAMPGTPILNSGDAIKQAQADMSKYGTVLTAENSEGMRKMQEVKELQSKALEGLDSGSQWVGEQLMSVAQNIPAIALGIIPGVGQALSLAVMGAIAAGDKVYEISEKGGSAGEAFARGTMSGAIEAATEVVSLDNLVGILKGEAKAPIKWVAKLFDNEAVQVAISNIMRQMGYEASEEMVSYIANYVYDRSLADPDAEFTIKELLGSGLGGAFSAVILGGLGIGIRGGINLINNSNSVNVQNEARNAPNPAEAEANDLASQNNGTAPPQLGNETANTENALQSVTEAVRAERSEAEIQGRVAEVRRAAASLGENGAKALTAAYDENMARMADPIQAVDVFNQVYNSALKGEQLSAEAESKAAALPQSLRIAAESAGQRDAARAAQAAYFGEDTGLVRNKALRSMHLSSRTIRALDAVARIRGVKTEIVDELLDANGEAVNAQYKDGVLQISAKAKNPVRAAFTHEIVHQIRESSPQAYKEMATFVQNNIKQFRPLLEYTYGTAYETSDINEVTEEIVADAFATITEHSDLLDRFVQDNRNAGQKLKDAIHDMIAAVQRALNNQNLQINENQRKAFSELMKDASEMEKLLENALKTGTNTTEANAEDNTSESVKHSRNVDFQGATSVNNTMSMAQARDMVQRAFVLAGIKDWYEGEYRNGDEWLKAQGADEVAMYIENEYTLQEKYLNKIPALMDGDISVEDILEAYVAGELQGTVEKPKAQRLDTTQNTDYQDSRFYAPKDTTGEDIASLYDKANQKVTKANRSEVNEARAKLLFAAHNTNVAETLGITQAEFNKKLRTWSRYSNKALEMSKRINQNVPVANRWTGIQNCAIINKVNITDDDILMMVKDISGKSTEYKRQYIARTMLALDTHIDWSKLSFEFKSGGFENKSSTRGMYSQNKIAIANSGYANTVAHEMGHALDAIWGRDLFGNERAGKGDIFLTDTAFRVDLITDPEARQFYYNFRAFVDSITDTSDIRSQYTQDVKEVFARFIAKFVEFTDETAGNTFYHESQTYSDRFTNAQFIEFARLLQEKAMLDAKKATAPKYSRAIDTSERMDYDSIYQEYNKPITREDIKAIQEIVKRHPRPKGQRQEVSVNDFTSADLQASQKWAYQYYNEFEKNKKGNGIKSPFFRSWFGDWRAADITPVEIADIPEYTPTNEFRKSNRGIYKNTDTGWNVTVSREGETNTIHHGGKGLLSEYGLSGIRKLVENAVLLDTEAHKPHKNNVQSDPVAFDHKLYALGQNVDGIALYKITVEEYFSDPRHTNQKKFHNLMYIEKVADIAGGRDTGNNQTSVSTNGKSTTTYTVTDLYDFVKQYDSNFTAAPEVNPSMLNKDGTPRYVYHWTNADITEFDSEKSGSNQGMTHGDGIYVSTSPNEFSYAGDRQMIMYARVTKPFEMQLTKKQAQKVYNEYFKPYHEDKYHTYEPHVLSKLQTPSRVFDYLKEAAKNGNTKTSKILQDLGYDGIHDGSEWVVFDTSQLKSATDNIGTFDRSTGDIRYSRDIGEVLNSQSETLDKLSVEQALKDQINEYAKTVKELNKAQQKADYWKGQTRLTKEPSVRESDVNKLARNLVKDYSSKVKTADIADRVRDLGNFILRGHDGETEMTWDEVRRRATDIARDVINNATALTDTGYGDYYAEIKNLLKDTQLRISRKDAADIADYKKWRKHVPGYLKLKYAETENSGNIDQVYTDLQRAYPWLFDEEVTGAASQLQRIIDVMEEIAPLYENPYNQNLSEAIETCANDMIYGMMENVRQTAPTYADRQQTKLEKQKAVNAEKLARQKAKSAEKLNAVIAENRKRTKELLTQIRADRDAKLEELKQHYREVSEAKRNRKTESEERTRLLKVAKRLQKMKTTEANRTLINELVGDLDTVAKSVTGKTLDRLNEIQA